MMTFPEKVISSWDEIEQNIRDQVDLKVKVESNKMKNTFSRYKEVMERAIV